MGDNIRNYLESWRSRYSYPNYIGDNQFLTSGGKLVEDTPNGYSAAQKTLVEGSAIGTASNYYLDPHPLFNRLGEIYSNILGSQAYSGARTDSIKMNRLNMDYTNGRVLRDLEKPQLECFKFISSNQSVSIYDARNGNALNNLLNLVLAFKDRNPKSEIIEINVREVTPNERDRIKYYNTLVQNTLTQFNNVLKEEKLDANPGNSTNNNKYFLKIKIIDSTDEASYERLYIIPSQNYYKVYTTYKNRRVAEHSGLQLLMPRYARRVEVEDLDENFWVIGQILDAVVKALWGPYGLIDVVRQIIYEVNKDKREDNVNDIKLLHDGSDDLYFDMYSRFTMNDLQLKLITDSGERIIKDIFKPHTNKSDRNSTTNGETSVPALFEEITEEMYGETYANDKDGDGIDESKLDVLLYGEGHKNFTGLFDSDLARSVPVPQDLNNKESSDKMYVSLSTIIDAINDKIVDDDVHYSGYYYAKKENDKKFFNIFDPTLGDNTFSGEDYRVLKSDVNNSLSNVIADKDMVNRLAKYEKSYNHLKNSTNLENDWPDFIKDYTKKIKLNLTGENAEVNKEKVLEDLYTEVSCQIPYVYLEYLMKLEKENNQSLEEEEKNSQHLIIEKINNELKEIFAELETTFYSTGELASRVLIERADDNTEESINNLYNRYLDLTNLGTFSKTEEQAYYIYNVKNGDHTTTYISTLTSTSPSAFDIKEFIPGKLTSFNPILRDTIPIYSVNVASQIANDLAQKEEAKKIKIGKYKFYNEFNPENTDDVLVSVGGKDVVETFFDIYKDGEITSRDPARISNFGATFGNSNYWNNMITLEKIIDRYFNELVIFVDNKNRITIERFFEEIFGIQFIKPEDLKRYIFTYIDNPLLDTTTTIKFHVPTPLFLSLFDIGDNFYKEGIDWSEHTPEERLEYAQYGFGILDNILIYLFDPEYYNLRYVKSVGSKHYPSLYVNAVDMYFDDVSNPIIPGNVFSGSNIPLFVPHSGLKNGEIIEMQIDGTSYTSSSNSHSHFDFDSALKYVNGETFKPLLKDGSDEKRMNLVLHNSFANNLRQYNYRTAYFIKETAPLYSPSDDNRPKSVADFFNRGIKVTYFRPQKIAQNIGNKTQSITTAQTIRKQLKIYASMIASKYQYIDNSYIINSDLGKTISKEDDKNYSYSIEAVEQGCIPDSYYLFNSKQAYCSAVRNNLVFYSTAGTNEYGQFLHSPLLALESPNKFTPSQTIQTPTLTSKGIAKGKDLRYYSLVTGPVKKDTVEQNFKLTGVKDMLYRDGYEQGVAPSIDIVWGRRQVSNYIKKKQLQYILIERELGDRHSIYAPTYVEIIAADGFLHDREGLMSKYVATYPVEWYGYGDNNKIQSLSTDNGYAPSKAIYGLVDLKSVIDSRAAKSYAGNYIIRIYSKSNADGTTGGEISKFADLKLNSEDFIISKNNSANKSGFDLVKRPIIKRIYFLGQSYSGARENRIWDNKD